MTARIFVEIRVVNAKGKTVITWYELEPIKADPEVAFAAWKLWKVSRRAWRRSGECYDCAIDTRGYMSCTCGDWELRQHFCKHLKALRDHGLLAKGAK